MGWRLGSLVSRSARRWWIGWKARVGSTRAEFCKVRLSRLNPPYYVAEYPVDTTGASGTPPGSPTRTAAGLPSTSSQASEIHPIGRYHNAKRSRKASSDSRQGGYDVAIGCPAHVHPQRVSAQRAGSLERHVEAAGTIWRAQRSQRTVGRPSTKREVGCWSLETGEWAGWDGMMRFE